MQQSGDILRPPLLYSQLLHQKCETKGTTPRVFLLQLALWLLLCDCGAFSCMSKAAVTEGGPCGSQDWGGTEESGRVIDKLLRRWKNLLFEDRQVIGVRNTVIHSEEKGSCGKN